MTNITIRFIQQLWERAIAVEKKLIVHGFCFSVIEDLGIREWWLDDDTIGEPDEILAKAAELDPELIQMAEVLDFEDPDMFDLDKGDDL